MNSRVFINVAGSFSLWMKCVCLDVSEPSPWFFWQRPQCDFMVSSHCLFSASADEIERRGSDECSLSHLSSTGGEREKERKEQWMSEWEKLFLMPFHPHVWESSMTTGWFLFRLVIFVRVTSPSPTESRDVCLEKTKPANAKVSTCFALYRGKKRKRNDTNGYLKDMRVPCLASYITSLLKPGELSLDLFVYWSF